MAEISLCMIVRNEEEILARCLDSAKSVADEIVIVDTGSSDRTKEIALKYTEKVYDFVWCDDFSAARNFAFSKAKKDFVMWLDADDVVNEKYIPAFLYLKEELLLEYDIVYLPYHTVLGRNGAPLFSYYRERIFRREQKPVWQGRVHETVSCTGRTLHIDSAAIEHHSNKKAYSKRNLMIYEKQLADEGMLSPRDSFYYGRELFYHRSFEEAKKHFANVIKDKNAWIPNRVDACRFASYCENDFERAFEWLVIALKFGRPCAELCCDIADVLFKAEYYEGAVFWYEAAIVAKPDMESGSFVDFDKYTFYPNIQLCVLEYRLGNIEKAKEYNHMAGSFRPDSEAYLYNLKFFEEI